MLKYQDVRVVCIYLILHEVTVIIFFSIKGILKKNYLDENIIKYKLEARECLNLG